MTKKPHSKIKNLRSYLQTEPTEDLRLVNDEAVAASDEEPKYSVPEPGLTQAPAPATPVEQASDQDLLNEAAQLDQQAGQLNSPLQTRQDEADLSQARADAAWGKSSAAIGEALLNRKELPAFKVDTSGYDEGVQQVKEGLSVRDRLQKDIQDRAKAKRQQFTDIKTKEALDFENRPISPELRSQWSKVLGYELPENTSIRQIKSMKDATALRPEVPKSPTGDHYKEISSFTKNGKTYSKLMLTAAGKAANPNAPEFKDVELGEAPTKTSDDPTDKYAEVLEKKQEKLRKDLDKREEALTVFKNAESLLKMPPGEDNISKNTRLATLARMLIVASGDKRISNADLIGITQEPTLEGKIEALNRFLTNKDPQRILDSFKPVFQVYKEKAEKAYFDAVDTHVNDALVDRRLIKGYGKDNILNNLITREDLRDEYADYKKRKQGKSGSGAEAKQRPVLDLTKPTQTPAPNTGGNRNPLFVPKKGN